MVNMIINQHHSYGKRQPTLPMKSSNLRFSPTKHIPMLSSLDAVGKPHLCAISRTSVFLYGARGNKARDRLASGTAAR